MQMLPPIGVGHLLYVFTWALLGLCVSAVAWSNVRTPTYKDYLAGTLGVSFEALGVEIAHGQAALIVPLTAGLFLALVVRYLPEDMERLQVVTERRTIRAKTMFGALLAWFFLIQVVILLFAYRGWWDRLILYPGD